MNSFADETLALFATRLSAEYDVECSSIQPIGAAAYGLPNCLSSNHGDEQCFVPCLSLSCMGRLPKNPIKSDGLPLGTDNFGQECSELLSRSSKFVKSTISSAPSFMLRNLVSSFGYILEVRLQQTILSIMESRERRLARNRQNKEVSEAEISKCYEDITRPFASLSHRRESTSTPISANTSFVTLLPASCTTNNIHLYDKVHMSLSFQSKICVRIPGGKILTAKIQAPGSIIGIFTDQGNFPSRIEVRVDTQKLFQSMYQESKSISKRIISTVVGPHVFTKKSTKPPLGDGNSTINSTSVTSYIPESGTGGTINSTSGNTSATTSITSSTPESPTSIIEMNDIPSPRRPLEDKDTKETPNREKFLSNPSIRKLVKNRGIKKLFGRSSLSHATQYN